MSQVLSVSHYRQRKNNLNMCLRLENWKHFPQTETSKNPNLLKHIFNLTEIKF